LAEGLRCVCASGFTGPDCEHRVCPHGKAWADVPSGRDVAHATAECSGQGYCDRRTGECDCRVPFGGAACERLRCPEDEEGVACSGHGQCVTMRWAADHWDGRVFVRPNVSYSLWDADQTTGCACDEGYAGFNCSLVECPRGDVPETTGQRNEKVHIECQGASGSFSVTFRGHSTRPVPVDAPPGHLEKYLEDLPSIGDVEITTANFSDSVCGRDTPVVTDVEFLTDFGDLPALRVLPSDDFAVGGYALALTRQFLYCDGPCDVINCTGGLYFEYDGEYTEKIAFNASANDVEKALAALSTLGGAASDFGPLNVSVSGSARLCGAQQNNLTISTRAAFGNVYELKIVNSLRRSDTGELLNVTLRSEKGTKENDYCSDRGWCDFATGTCMCRQLATSPYYYEYASSDGYDNPGTRGDCGHAARKARSCPRAFNNVRETFMECGGRGSCDNATFVCDCEEGFYGGDCSLRRCPRSKPWFFEATGPNEAHVVDVECAGMGYCDRGSGSCVCRDGFGGSACQRLDCPRDKELRACSGKGRCLPMFRMADFSPAGPETTYGAATRENEAQWDSRRVYGCRCDTPDATQPHSGPVSFISGIEVKNPNLGGYAGYDCSRRWCPAGDSPKKPGLFEIQTIRCDGSSSFTVTFRGQTTRAIASNATFDLVEAALENLTTIGDVDVAFSNGKRACDPAWQYDADRGMAITFLSELGDLPLMTTDPAYNVSETEKGTKRQAECSDQGYCDYDSGLCECLTGYVGSDADGNIGSRRDCGRLDGHGATLNEYRGLPGGN